MNTMIQEPIYLDEASKAFRRRVAFDALQRSIPGTLIPAFDPDPPVELSCQLRKFDPLIMTLLKRVLPNSQGPSQPVPLPTTGVPKAACLARKVASGHPHLTEKELNKLADRISWLLRNWFRHDARDGYGKCLQSKKPRPKKLSASATKTQTSPSQAGAKGTNLPQPAAPQIAPPPPLAQAADTSSPMPSSGELEEQFDEAGKGETPALLELFGTQNQRVSSAPNLAAVAPADDDDFTFGVRSMGGPNLSIQPDAIAADRAEWQREIDQYRPTDAPKIPPKPSTYPSDIAPSLARSFLWGVYYQNDVQILTSRARRLVADSDQLSLALSHSETAREDILKSLAFLGIDLC